MIISGVLSTVRSVESGLAALQSGSTPAAVPNHWQIKRDLQAINTDLQAGNVSGAQQDFATLLKDSPHLQAEMQSGQTTPQASALNALSSALQSGNVSGAQTALSSLQQAMPGEARMARTTAEYQALNQALASGDLASAQQAFAQLKQDNPKLAAALAPSAATTGA